MDESALPYKLQAEEPSLSIQRVSSEDSARTWGLPLGLIGIHPRFVRDEFALL